MPMYASIGYYGLESFELSNNERAVRPRTSIGDVEVVATCFWREFTTFLDEISELGLAALEFAGLIPGCYPVCDFVCLRYCWYEILNPAVCSLTILAEFEEENCRIEGFEVKLSCADD